MGCLLGRQHFQWFPDGICHWAPPDPAQDNVAAADPESGSFHVEHTGGVRVVSCTQAGLDLKAAGETVLGLTIPVILVGLYI